MICYGKKKSSYSLGNKIGHGGEGAIYEINGNSELVAKIYFDNKFNPTPRCPYPRQELKEKIETMLAQPVNPYVNGVLIVAWPQDILFNEFNEFIGYVMPRVKSKYHIFAASRERERIQLYPHYTWKTAITIAYNLALTIKLIHQSNAVVGDMNPNNIMVDENGYVTIIDTDSFNITNKRTGKIYKCNVGIAEMLPPELQGKDLSDPKSVFNMKTDSFSLAIHICNLILNNCHPFGCTGFAMSKSSTSVNPVVYNITRGNCTFVTNAKAKAPPEAPDIKMLPADIRNLIDRSFRYSISTAVKASTIDKRPTAEEWQVALGKLLNTKMAICKKAYPDVHVYPASYHTCPWCKGTKTIPISKNKKAAKLRKNITVNKIYDAKLFWIICIVVGLFGTPFLSKYFIPMCYRFCSVALSNNAACIVLAIAGAITGGIIAYYGQNYYLKSDYPWLWCLLSLLVPFAAFILTIIFIGLLVLAIYLIQIILSGFFLILFFLILISAFCSM